MTDYKAMIEEHSCKPNQGCGVMTICMCGVAEDMADEIERLRKENQELKLQYLSDQGQWIEETGRLREALRKIDRKDTYNEDSYGPFAEIARAALGEKE